MATYKLKLIYVILAGLHLLLPCMRVVTVKSKTVILLQYIIDSIIFAFKMTKSILVKIFFLKPNQSLVKIQVNFEKSLYVLE